MAFQKRVFSLVFEGVYILVDVSDIFLFFLLGGRGRESPRLREGGGGGFFVESPRRKGLPAGWEGGREAGRVFAGNLGGGDQIFFCSGPKFPPRCVRHGRKRIFLVILESFPW